MPLKMLSAPLWRCAFVFSFLILVACSSTNGNGQVFRVTVAPTQVGIGAPVFTATPPVTNTPLPTATDPATSTPTPTETVTPTPTLEFTLTPSPTPPIATLTPAVRSGLPPAFSGQPAALAAAEGWSCGDFPCEDDLAGWMQRIQVPEGYSLSHLGRFPGQPMQITYGPDGRLYATVLEKGTRFGAVYAMDADGTTERYSPALIVSPNGLAFQPGTDVLYIAARVNPTQGGGVWRLRSDRVFEPVVTDLPCCFQVVDNQPNGLVFGPDGFLYLSIGALTDHGEAFPGSGEQFAGIQRYEASILRIHPHTGEIEVYARGLRNPYDLTFDSTGQFYATDQGIVEGPGDRLLQVFRGSHYGWPYWQPRGCTICPPRPADVAIEPDFVTFRNYTLPRGIVAYTGTQFPEHIFDTLFVALWNGTPDAQRIVRIDPRDSLRTSAGYRPEPFVTGLIRPIDVTIAPDGALVVADFVYGHIWKVSYNGASGAFSDSSGG